MKISAKTDYACRALLELALYWPKKAPVSINTIATNQQIPINFLPHILIQLKQLGYVESIRGNKGGYVLAKSPKQIRVSEVVKGFTEAQLTPSKQTARFKKFDVMGSIWQEADQILQNFMGSINFEDISKRERSLTKIPMYTI